jgi:hypothetical protein
MSLALLFTIVQVLYWVALSAWFGSAFFVAIAAPIIMRTVREHQPVLPTVLSVNLEGQHGTLLGQTIIGELIGPLHRIGLIAAALLLVTLVAQWILVHPRNAEIVGPALRSALYVAAVTLLIYDWRVAWPRTWRIRQEYLDNADNPEIANAALDRFERATATTGLNLQIMVGLLLGILLFSTNIRLPAVYL